MATSSSSFVADDLQTIPVNVELFYQNSFLRLMNEMSRDARKPVFGVSDQVRHKPLCAVSEYGKKLEISDLGRREIVLSEWRKQRR